MAVRTEQNTLGCLGTRDGQRPCHALLAQVERLARRVDVVEVQSANAAIVAAQRAATSSVLYEYLLDLPPPTNNRVARHRLQR